MNEEQRAVVAQKIRPELEKDAAKLAMFDELVVALEVAEKIRTEALPKFNWGASALDANAIGLLNIFDIVSIVLDRARELQK